MYRADEVVEPGLATREEAQRLETHEDALVLRVARTVVDEDGVPLEYMLLTYLADAYTYRTTVLREAEPGDRREGAGQECLRRRPG